MKSEPSGNTPFSRRALCMGESLTVATTAKAGALKRRGIDIISLSAGEPDFDTPQHIKDAAVRAIAEGKTKYAVPATGIPELKQAVCDKLLRDNGLSYDPSQVLVACGAKQIIFDAVVALIDDGDEAVIPAPYWVSYADQVRLMGGRPVVVETAPENGFRISARQLKNAISSRSKFVLLNSPCNPTGEVYTREELQALAEVIEEAGVFVISDEIYEKIVYDGAAHISIAALNPAVKEKTLVVNGVSKAYAMTGWRVGYGAGPSDLIALMGKIQSQETTSTCTVSQWAALEALRGPQEGVETMRGAFQERRDAIVARLNAIAGFTCRKPQGAFYVFPDVSALYGRSAGPNRVRNDIDLCHYLLDTARVAGVPGSGFGADKHIRFSYAASMAQIQEAMDRIAQAVAKLEEDEACRARETQGGLSREHPEKRPRF